MENIYSKAPYKNTRYVITVDGHRTESFSGVNYSPIQLEKIRTSYARKYDISLRGVEVFEAPEFRSVK